MLDLLRVHALEELHAEAEVPGALAARARLHEHLDNNNNKMTMLVILC